MLYVGETGRRPRVRDRFRKHLKDVKYKDRDGSKPVSKHFNLPNHSFNNVPVFRLSLNQSNTENHKNSEQKCNFRIIGTHGINERL